MAKVLILSSDVSPKLDVWKHSSAFLLKHSAELDTFGMHTLTDDPAEAERLKTSIARGFYGE